MTCACGILLSVACMDLKCVSTLPAKRNDFRTKVIEYKMCVLIFTVTLSETYLILRRTEQAVIKKVDWFSCKLSVTLV